VAQELGTSTSLFSDETDSVIATPNDLEKKERYKHSQNSSFL